MIILKEGYIHDFITEKPVDIRKPEEKVRQEYEKMLHEDYYYPKQNMAIEVPIQMGSNTKKADIVIYGSLNRDQYKDIIGVIETKSNHRKDGIDQLASYMQASSAIFGVWTNGNEIEYLFKDNNGMIRRDYLFSIPKYGETVATMGDVSKDKLQPVKNLKPIFRRILNTLYSNTNISRKEKLGSEMIKLLFCKIIDEKYEVNSKPEFTISIEESQKGQYDLVEQRIKGLFKKVKDDLSDEDIFSNDEKISLEAKSIAYVVGELKNIALLKTEKDVVGEAFETFAENKLVGEKGEFFTPREVVKLAIELLDPSPNKTVIDPACGSGGFLIYALEHVWKKMDNDPKYKNSPDLRNLKKQVAEKCFYGIDKENDLVKICKAYMTIIGDGKSKIVQENTLHQIDEYNSKAKDLFGIEEDGILKFKQFDFVITNPPFGTKIKVMKEDAKHYDLGHKWKYEKDGRYTKTNIPVDTPPQELFIERCLQLLKPKGKLAIVLPDTYFHAPTKKHILNYLLKDNNLIAIIDLPHNTFRPYCNAKTSLAIIQKAAKQSDNIIMAVAEEMGHDHKGDYIYRYDKESSTFLDEVWDDTKIILNELKAPNDSKNINTFVLPHKDIVNNLIVPKFYWNSKLNYDNVNYNYITIRELINKGIIKVFRGHGSPKSEYKGKGEIPYVRVDDIMNWQIYKNPTSGIPKNLFDTLIKSKRKLQEGDILFVKEGSYRIGSVAYVTKFDTEVYVNSHTLIFTIVNKDNQYKIDAQYLLYLLSTEFVQNQLANNIMIDTTLPNIGDRWNDLVLPLIKDNDKLQEIRHYVNTAVSNLSNYSESITEINKNLGKIIT